MRNNVAPQGRKYVAIWLYVIAALVLGMVLLGGVTRLTGSGLSMVDWRPIMGSIPPIGHDAWTEVFEKYKQFPQYKKVNSGMSMSEFKFIFSMEYGHRLLGRLVGLVFAFPFIFFLWKRWLKGPMIRRGALLFFLGGLQGLIGWYMVKSGLVDKPQVSQYRLTLHLSLATFVYALSLWFAFSLHFANETHQQLKQIRWKTIGLLCLVSLQIISGGFVAGLHAGHAFNTFPTMNGRWIPEGMTAITPVVLNLFDNPVTVQFFHRCMAYVVTTVVLIYYFRKRAIWRESNMPKAIHFLPALLLLQVGLGITTLLMRVPVALGSLHQIGAVMLLTIVLFLSHRTSHVDA